MIRHVVMIALCVAGLVGCKSASTASVPDRRPDVALEKLSIGTKLIQEGDDAKAEKYLLEALDADAYCGMAHNNLALIYYREGRMYDADWRFQNAARLLPHQPEPRNNLGLVLEQAGKMNEAITEYQQALDLEPKNPELLGNLLRARVRRGDSMDELRPLLQELVMIETRPEWRAWAERELALRSASPTAQP